MSMPLDDLTRAQTATTQGIHRLYADRARVIRDVKAEGHTWPEIATTLGMTQHGAIKASKVTD